MLLTKIRLEIQRNQYEPEVSMETLTQFDSMVPENTIKLIKTNIKYSLYLVFNESVARRLLLEGLNGSLDMQINTTTPDCSEHKHVAVFEIEVRNSRLSEAKIHIMGNSLNIFGRFRLLNTILHETFFLSKQLEFGASCSKTAHSKRN